MPMDDSLLFPHQTRKQDKKTQMKIYFRSISDKPFLQCDSPKEMFTFKVLKVTQTCVLLHYLSHSVISWEVIIRKFYYYYYYSLDRLLYK